ncbi:MAG: SDR family NAD(P)-dependent oxidoreductase [Reyranellales bacterium]
MARSPNGRVAGKIALVTGAANGLGRAIALRLAEEGASLVLTDIDADGLAETERQLKAAASTGSNTPPVVVNADVTEEVPVKALFKKTFDTHGRLDILVNDVGGGTSGRIWEVKLEDWDHIIKLNLRSAFLCTREAAGHMKERRSGCIINLSSGAREGTPWTAYYIGNSAYSTAKAGIHGFTRGVALELAEYGVRVNAVAPGPIETERTGPGFRKIEQLEYGPIRATPLRRIGVPEDIANAVLYLASDEAQYITGTTLPVAGGR